MLHIIGLGLNEKSYGREAYDLISKADKIYIENYTVNFPYDIKNLEKQFPKKKFIKASRELVESSQILKESKKSKVALLIYGNPLIATTHISLIQEAKKQKIKYKIIHNASVLDAIGETGLQIYKFGKIASIPKHEASSFLDIVKDNKKINAHTLILVDIGLDLKDTLKKLKGINEKIILCSRLGNKNQKIFYKKLSELENKEVKKPFSIIIPGKLHFMEEEVLKGFN